MNYDSVKISSEVKLEGVTVDIEKRAGNVNSITFTDAAGNTVKVAKDSYSEIAILVPAKPKKETKYAVAGKVLGIAEHKEVFDTQYDAQARLNEILKENNYPDKDAGLEVKPVEVEIPF
jgi:hypothetical protein